MTVNNIKLLTGLYITLEDDGYIKRNLITKSGEKQLPRSTIKDEIIEFSELNFGPYTQVVNILDGLANQTTIANNEIFISFYKSILEELENESPALSVLIEAEIEDSLPIDDGSTEYIELSKYIIPKIFRNAMDFNLFLNDVFYNIYTKNPIEENTEHYFYSQMIFKQELTFYGKIASRYFFRSLTEYYVFLLMHFLEEQPKVTRCECCGRYFVPKTNRETKYCDRILKGNKTCKELAPKLKHKKIVKNDQVIEAYDKAKQKMYRRYERNDGRIDMPEKGLTLNEFYEWNDAATSARNKYLNGELSAEETLKIIEVND